MEIGNDIKGQTRAVQIKSGQQIIPASSEADAQGPYVCFDIKWKLKCVITKLKQFLSL